MEITESEVSVDLDTEPKAEDVTVEEISNDAKIEILPVPKSSVALTVAHKLAIVISSILVIFLAAFLCLTLTVKYAPDDPDFNPFLRPSMKAFRKLLFGSGGNLPGAITKSARLELAFSSDPIRGKVYRVYMRNADGSPMLTRTDGKVFLANEQSATSDSAANEWEVLQDFKEKGITVVPAPFAFYSKMPFDYTVMELPDGQTAEQIFTGSPGTDKFNLAGLLSKAMLDYSSFPVTQKGPTPAFNSLSSDKKDDRRTHMDLNLSSFWISSDRARLFDFTKVPKKSEGFNMYQTEIQPNLSALYDPVTADIDPALADRQAFGLLLIELFTGRPGWHQQPEIKSCADISSIKSMIQDAKIKVDDMRISVFTERPVADLFLAMLSRDVAAGRIDDTTAIVLAALVGDPVSDSISYIDLVSYFNDKTLSTALQQHVSNIKSLVSKAGGWNKAVLVPESFAYVLDGYVGSILETGSQGKLSAVLLYSRDSQFQTPVGSKVSWNVPGLGGLKVYRIPIPDERQPIASITERFDESAASHGFYKMQKLWRGFQLFPPKSSYNYLLVNPKAPEEQSFGRFRNLLYLPELEEGHTGISLLNLENVFMSPGYSLGSSLGLLLTAHFDMAKDRLQLPFCKDAQDMPTPDDMVRVFNALAGRLPVLADHGIVYDQFLNLTGQVLIRPDDGLVVLPNPSKVLNLSLVGPEDSLKRSWASLCGYFTRTATNVVIVPQELRIPSASGLDTIIKTCMAVNPFRSP